MKFSSASLVVAAVAPILGIMSASSFAESECLSGKSTTNELSFLDDGVWRPVPKVGRAKFKLSQFELSQGKRLLFRAKIRKLDPDDDFAVLIKAVGTSASEKAKNTQNVWLARGKFRNGKGSNTPFEADLAAYSKYHFDDGRDPRGFDYDFHTPYKYKGKTTRTDRRSKRRLFRFDNVPNTYSGSTARKATRSLFAGLFGSTVQANEYRENKTDLKYVLLHSELRDLSFEPCFQFKLYIPKSVQTLSINLTAIEEEQSDHLEGERSWNGEKTD
jgi:hypothetical protein